jgi:hypothetical protein
MMPVVFISINFIVLGCFKLPKYTINFSLKHYILHLATLQVLSIILKYKV